MPFSVASPSFEQKQAHTWRGITRQDLRDIWKLFQVVNRHDNNDYTESVNDLENQFDDPWSNPESDGRIVRTLRGKLAAFARVFVNPNPKNENVAFLVCECDPDERDRGLEQECIEWMQERATERLTETAQTDEARALPRLVRTFVPESDTRKLALFAERGFVHVRSFFEMERALNEPVPANPLPTGLTLRTYGEDIDGSMLDAFNEAFSDHWGSQQVTEPEWHPFIMDVSDVRRDLTLVVMNGDEVVAFSINRVKQQENERLGIKRGWIGSLGTRRKWRRRGIASALLAESMRRFKQEGLDNVGLGVDAENLTGALALYERIGFHPFKTGLILEKRVG